MKVNCQKFNSIFFLKQLPVDQFFSSPLITVVEKSAYRVGVKTLYPPTLTAF